MTYLCDGCLSDQPVVTSATTVARHPCGIWVASVTCNDCGHSRHVPVSDAEAAEIVYWQTVDARNREARLRAYGRAAVAEAEQIVREGAG